MTIRPLQAVQAPPAPRPATPSVEGSDPIEDRFDACTCHGAAPAAEKTGWAWGRKGHEIVSSEAVRALPDDMPGFFKANADRLETLGPQPDRWRFRELKHLKGANVPDHYMNYEPVAGKDLPADRYAYVRMIQDEELVKDGKAPQLNGMLPYRLAEVFETLVAELALYRIELERSPEGKESPLLRQLQENALYAGGLLSHYVADATQPLHSTVHHDGWNEAVEPNPGGFRTRPGLHREFETFLVNEAVTPEEVRRRIPAAQVFEGDPLHVGVGLIQESNGMVKRLYRLEAEGKLNPWRPHPEGVELATDRVARGAQVLRDLWYSAWVRSEAVARGATQPAPAHEGFLIAR